jgi:hypothetical protein
VLAIGTAGTARAQLLLSVTIGTVATLGVIALKLLALLAGIALKALLLLAIVAQAAPIVRW